MLVGIRSAGLALCRGLSGVSGAGRAGVVTNPRLMVPADSAVIFLRALADKLETGEIEIASTHHDWSSMGRQLFTIEWRPRK